MQTETKKHTTSKLWLWVGIGIAIVIGTVAAGLLVKNASTNDVQAPAIAEDTRVITVDASKLPQDWSVTGNDGQNVALVKGKDQACFVSVNKIPDTVVKVTDATEYLQVQKEVLQKAMAEKGYTSTDVPIETVSLQTNQGTQSVKALVFDLSGTDTLRQSYGYLVRDGYVVKVQRSCKAASDLPLATKALAAVQVRI